MPVTGTVYTVYSDKDCAESVGTLTIGADGKSNTLSVLYGTYYVKETKAAEGYILDTKVYVLECKDSKEVEIRKAGPDLPHHDETAGEVLCRPSG